VKRKEIEMTNHVVTAAKPVCPTGPMTRRQLQQLLHSRRMYGRTADAVQDVLLKGLNPNAASCRHGISRQAVVEMLRKLGFRGGSKTGEQAAMQAGG
jgi:hypothetical protein